MPNRYILPWANHFHSRAAMSFSFASADESVATPSLLIVGAGVGGLAVARLCASSWRVTVVERDDRVGGLASTVACSGGGTVELGPSHHLSSHKNLRALLEYGEPSSPEKVFGRSDETLHCEEAGPDLLTLSSVAREERDALSREKKPSRKCVPWADETGAFSVADAASGAKASDGAQRLTARLGYQKTFDLVRQRLALEEGVRFVLGTRVTTLSRRGDKFFVGTDASVTLSSFDAVVLACPPGALRRLRLPREVRALVPSAFETVPVASRRTVLCFRRVPSALRGLMVPGTHYSSDVDGDRGFGWAVVLSPTVLLLSYVDGTRAEKQLSGEVPLADVVSSFLSSLRRQGLVRVCLTTEELLENADVHVGGSSHAFHVPGDGEAKPQNDRVFFVGEAYGPVPLRAWMEAACVSAVFASRALRKLLV